MDKDRAAHIERNAHKNFTTAGAILDADIVSGGDGLNGLVYAAHLEDEMNSPGGRSPFAGTRGGGGTGAGVNFLGMQGNRAGMAVSNA